MNPVTPRAGTPAANRRSGDIAAVLEAVTVIIGVAAFATYLTECIAFDPTPPSAVSFVIDRAIDGLHLR